MYMANGGIFLLSFSPKGKDVGRIVICRGIALGLQYFVLSRICETLESWTIFLAHIFMEGGRSNQVKMLMRCRRMI